MGVRCWVEVGTEGDGHVIGTDVFDCKGLQYILL